ncbi:hypothetical protein TrRE_jg8264 [Triparma retinervis]|uniref:Uncharacterized protein n=1 Tax=Triparma retinervis TaxID=2557542 RepID=A0A9W7KUS4_9STRA|nr:hypothetical protein TrRE_jg8264 [Triparma retinervis]
MAFEVDVSKSSLPLEYFGDEGMRHAGSCDVKSVAVGFNVAEVEEKAFYQCFNLMSCSFPTTIIHLCNSAFASCPSLLMVDLSSTTLSSVGSGVFQGCHGLSSILLPPTCEMIGCRAFANCSSLTSIKLPHKVKVIETELFFGCARLEDVAFPSSLIGLTSDTRISVMSDSPPSDDVTSSIPPVSGPMSGPVSSTTLPAPSIPPRLGLPVSPILSSSSTTTITFFLDKIPLGSLLSDFAHPSYSSCAFRVIPTRGTSWFFHPTFNHIAFKKFYPSPSLRSRQGRKHSSLSSHLTPSFRSACMSYWSSAVRHVEARTSTDAARVVLGFLMDEGGVRMFFKAIKDDPQAKGGGGKGE